MATEVREFVELGYTVLANVVNDVCVDFEIYDGDDDPFSTEGPIFKGAIKWDGCSNWWQFTNLHFCGLTNTKKFCNLFEELYKLANEMLPDKDVLHD